MRSTILLSLGISIFYQWTAFASHFSFFPLSASSEFTFQSWASWNLCWHYCSVCRTAHLTGEARTWIWPARKMISLQLNTSAPPINIMVRTENSAWSHLGTYQKKKITFKSNSHYWWGYLKVCNSKQEYCLHYRGTENKLKQHKISSHSKISVSGNQGNSRC